MSTIQKHWRKHAKPHKSGYCVVPEIRCKDGFAMSVQASATHYCIPRDLLKTGKYAAWEVGFPTKRVAALMPFRERAPGKPTESVYSCVPTDVIDTIIEKHGGLAA